LCSPVVCQSVFAMKILKGNIKAYHEHVQESIVRNQEVHGEISCGTDTPQLFSLFRAVESL
jgi:hypothetical protein